MTKRIILIGGGGHARVLAEIIRLNGHYHIVGILDSGLKASDILDGLRVLGDDSLLPGLIHEGVGSVCIGLGSVKDNSKREELYIRAKDIGYTVPQLIHPGAFVANGVKMSEGVQVMVGATVQVGCVIGKSTIINTGAIIDHDCLIGNHVHISSGAVITGGCRVGDGAFIGANATIVNGITVGIKAVVAAGAVAIRDVGDEAVVKGVPAR